MKYVDFKNSFEIITNVCYIFLEDSLKINLKIFAYVA